MARRRTSIRRGKTLQPLTNAPVGSLRMDRGSAVPRPRTPLGKIVTLAGGLAKMERTAVAMAERIAVLEEALGITPATVADPDRTRGPDGLTDTGRAFVTGLLRDGVRKSEAQADDDGTTAADPDGAYMDPEQPDSHALKDPREHEVEPEEVDAPED